MIMINIEKAKEIHKNNLRSARIEEFKKLDVEYIRAMEENNREKIEQIVEAKTRLRNITTAEEIATAETLDDLKAHWPTDILSSKSPYSKE
jgi:protein-tyrosine-phosphatase